MCVFPLEVYPPAGKKQFCVCLSTGGLPPSWFIIICVCVSLSTGGLSTSWQKTILCVSFHWEFTSQLVHHCVSSRWVYTAQLAETNAPYRGLETRVYISVAVAEL